MADGRAVGRCGRLITTSKYSFYYFFVVWTEDLKGKSPRSTRRRSSQIWARVRGGYEQGIYKYTMGSSGGLVVLKGLLILRGGVLV